VKEHRGRFAEAVGAMLSVAPLEAHATVVRHVPTRVFAGPVQTLHSIAALITAVPFRVMPPEAVSVWTGTAIPLVKDLVLVRRFFS
jgi:hypothetical protein